MSRIASGTLFKAPDAVVATSGPSHLEAAAVKNQRRRRQKRIGALDPLPWDISVSGEFGPSRGSLSVFVDPFLLDSRMAGPVGIVRDVQFVGGGAARV